MYGENVPGGGAACGHYTTLCIGKNKIRFRAETDFWIAFSEQFLIAPVGRCVTTIEQSGLGQHHRARTGRVKRGACFIHLGYPFHELRITPLDIFIRTQPELGQYQDTGFWVVCNRAVRRDRNPVTAGEGLYGRRDDADSEQGLPGLCTNQRLPDISCGQKYIHHTVERGTCGLRDGDDQHLHRTIT